MKSGKKKGMAFLRRLIISVILLFYILPATVQANTASPHIVHENQPDGTEIALRIKGSEALRWQEDLDGFTVLRTKSGHYVYARRGVNGRLVPTEHKVGKANPKALGLKRRELPSPAVRAIMRADSPAALTSDETTQTTLQQTTIPQVLNNLVVLIRFSDHTDRAVPAESDIDVLMNAIGGDPDLAPAGSLRDIYLNNSYGALTIDSTVVAWATVSHTEAYYADGASGLVTKVHEALGEALDIVDEVVDFSSFDQDHDGYIDAITFLHSGYGAEWGGTDAYGAYYTDRIWSHKWAISGSWLSAEGVRVYDYHISPALWGTSGSTIGRIGVIAHETGHFLGLPDLYDTDTSGGDGIGSWGLMANSWGGDGSQQPPPLMSAWSKMQLGWLTPTDLSASGYYSQENSLASDLVYRVTDGFPLDEYLLIENRRRRDASNALVDNIPISGDGLVVYHVDDAAGYNTEGYPGQPGWPENGNHYRVAVLQADGNYNLEKGDNRGDSGDAYRSGAVLGPATTPNTDAYQDGVISPTDHEFSEFSGAGASMNFAFNINQIPSDPPTAPTDLTATAVSAAQIDLSWTVGARAETQEVLRSADAVSFTPVATLGPEVNVYADSGLAAATTYTYQIRAVNSSGSAVSASAAAVTMDISPQAYAIDENTVSGTLIGSYPDTYAEDGTTEQLTEILAGNAKNGRSLLDHSWQIGPVAGGAPIILTVAAWTDSALEGFTFSCSVDNGITYTDVLTVDQTTPQQQMVEFLAGASDTVYLRVTDTDNSRGETALDSLLVDYIMIESLGEVVLVPPTNLSGSALSSSEIALSWNDVIGESGYIVEYRENGTTGWQLAIADLAADSTGYTVNGLTSGTAYDFLVSSFDETSQTASVQTVEPITTLEEGVIDVVTIVTAEYKVTPRQLLVEAISTQQPQAVLTLVGFGEMTYSAADGKYLYQNKTDDPGATLTVISDLGGSSTTVVVQK